MAFLIFDTSAPLHFCCFNFLSKFRQLDKLHTDMAQDMHINWADMYIESTELTEKRIINKNQ